MIRKTKLSCAIASALVANTALIAGATAAQLEEVVVTASKRAENLQDVPISVATLTGDSLKELGVQTFDQYVEYLPNVVNAGIGPGQKEIYIRGSASEQSSLTVAPAQGSAPGVALYLDEMPVSFGARNLDLYAADLERVEVLSGPQGTLFGASSQSGNVRMITNKPDVDGFDAAVNLGFSNTSGGDDSTNVEAMVNVPLSDRLAVRVVGYSDRQGGWIDNERATFTPNPTIIDRNNFAGFGPILGRFDQSTYRSADNSTLVKDDWNTATYTGYRAGVKFDVTDDWSILVQHTNQKLEVEGSFLIDPSLGDDTSAKFTPEYNDDEFELTTWTVEGRIANLDVLYTGGYLDREVESLIDYTHYNNGGGYITYYLCSGNIYTADPSTAVNSCFDPTKQYADHSSNERTTHEFRISSDPDKRFRWLAGVYINEVETTHIGEFQYFSTNDAFSDHIVNYFGSGSPFQVGNTTIPNVAGTNTSGPRSPVTTFFNDFGRTEDETAYFGELAFDLTDDLTISVSARRYEFDTELEGAANFSFGCRYGVPGIPGAPAGAGFGNAEPTADGRCNSNAFSNDVTARFDTVGQYNATGDDNVILNATSPNGARDMFRGGGSNAATLAAIKDGSLDVSDINSDGSTTEEDTIVKVSVDWQATDDIMLFGVFAEGYRPATQNRNVGQLATNQTGVYEGYVVPAVAVTDTLESMEFGIKSELLDGALRLNATIYQTEIENLQVSRFDPSNVAFLVFMENVGDAETKGLDVDFQWAATDNLTISGAFSILDTEITRLNPQLLGIAAPVGSELPLASDFAGNIRARYDFTMDNFGADAFVAASVTYRGETLAGIAGSADFMDDTQLLQFGSLSGLGVENEGGDFGTVVASDGSLPSLSRFENEAATTLNISAGMMKDNWTAEFYVNNLTSEEGMMAQTAGKFMPEATVLRPRTMGVRLGYRFE